ncbi:glycosyltransferase family 2 protein [Shewanella submarina]|uniref:Glycosyltransferase family 2 protein n=1 Tax=Shewanella submarina TaxID=2016376 RepID=A0ABV7GKV0_9GAMM|nr:glycosyltransferase family 2 protein [Shewanella submarina]MCL1036544.1 glycosyltransferase family 2 protein [Shewanella submarina]
MNVNPLISIVVPVYNHENYIVECLDSVILQDYKNIEVLICNDGSTDNSDAKIKEWLAKHPDIKSKYISQENQGVCKTLNTLVSLARGEYITICASDDSLTSTSISSRLECLTAYPDKLACIGDATVIDQHSSVVSDSAMISLYHSNMFRLQKNIVDELVLRWAVVGPTLLISKKAYDKVGCYNEELAIEDRDFYLRLLAHDLLVFIPQAVANYRVHTGNLSRKSVNARLVVALEVAKSNLINSELYEGKLRWFLKSHKLDLLLINYRVPKLSFLLLSIYKVIRKAIVKVII